MNQTSCNSVKLFLCSSFFVSSIARSGTIPSATKMEATSTNIIVNGIDEINCPVTPERKNNGANTATVVIVPAISGQAYSFIDATAA